MEYETAIKVKKKAKAKEKFTGILLSSGIQNSIDKSFAQMKKYDRKNKRWQRLTDTMTYIIYITKRRIWSYCTLLKSLDLNNWLTFLISNMTFHLRNTSHRLLIPSLYNNIRDKVAAEISKVENFQQLLINGQVKAQHFIFQRLFTTYIVANKI